MRPAGRIDRRGFLAGAGAVAAAPLLPRLAAAELRRATPLYGISAFGDLKYGPDFEHFDYANPDAPKGGTFNFAVPNWGYNQSVLTFNTLNTFVPRGDAPPRMEFCFDSLMVGALDEPDAAYGLLAKSVAISQDGNAFTFELRPQARFHDGSRLTADDVAFTFETFKEKGHPSLALPLIELEAARALDDQTVEVRFNGEQSARTVFSLVGMPIVSQAFFAGHPFDASELVAPLGSGPYRVGHVSPGRTIEYDRVEDYWARDLPVRKGLFHFDRLRIEFYRDRNAAFEAFKKGNIHYREEFTSRTWATGYDFPALTEGKVVKRKFPSELVPSMQAWALNQRRARFADPRTREAIGLCFDFEWTNRNLFYGAYERSNSVFEKSDYAAEGEPGEAELALLSKFRGDIPEAAFGPAVTAPQSDGSGRDRDLLRRARQLVLEAGWRPAGGLLRDGDGNTLALEMLVNDEVFVRVNAPFVDNMRAIGINATIRLVDSAQFQVRQNDFDFDMIGMAASFGATPTRDTLVNFFHSRTADISGSRNLPGTRSAAVDALIGRAGGAATREELVTTLRVMDRILRARRDWIPNWHAPNHRVAFWDMFGFDEPKPDYGFPVEALWWYDEEKAKAIGRA